METREILEQVKSGTMSVEEAEGHFRRQPFEDMGFAKLDMHRKIRSGFPEVIFCKGKPDAFLVSIYKRMVEEEGKAFGTRASKEQYEKVREAIPDIQYDPISGILKLEREQSDREGLIADRLLSQTEKLQNANCIVAVAGMEGALASVVGGLVSNPVIAVPTSVGYGANFGGLSALLTMINSCANGIAVVNINNGYGAGYMATQINRLACGGKSEE